MFRTTQKGFYRKALAIALPVMLQNGITNFVSMLDNIMVGRVGTAAMSGVSIVNQLLFVFTLCVFGGMSGIGIFTAQFYGKGDDEGVRQTFRLQIFLGILLTAAGLLIFLLYGHSLIELYLTGEGGTVDVQATRDCARAYLQVMLLELAPLTLTTVYATTLRSCGETVLPMQASMAAVVINLCGNYILIYGKFGAPALGAVGAAVATVIARFVELAFIMIRTHRSAERFAFIKGAYRHLTHIPVSLIKQTAAKGTPLLINEALWSGGMAVLNQTYSVRGLDVIAAVNISSTISNLFNIAFIAMGSATSIIIGQELGAGMTDRVKEDAYRLTGLSCVLCLISGTLLFACAGVFPQIYNTSDSIRSLAAGFIRIAAVCMPMYAFENSVYFVLRSGGKTFITFLFDSCFVWVASIPLAWVLVHHTGLPILQLYMCVQAIELGKCLIGWIFMQKGIWIQDLTNL